MRRPFTQFTRALCAAVLVLAAALWGGVALALDARRALTEYGHDTWQDELPQNTVHAITQTPDGYIWLGTYEGVVRFDGVSFTVFDHRNTPEIRSSSIWALLADRQGRLWIGTQGGGLAMLEEGTFTAFGTDEGLTSNFVYCIYEDRAGTLWIGTNGGLTALADEKAVARYTTGDGLAGNAVRVIHEDREGVLWIGTDSGLTRFKDGQFTSYTEDNGLPENSVRAIRQDGDDSLWVGTYGSGIVRMSDGRITPVEPPPGFEASLVYTFFEDREGNCWVGTDGGGLGRLRDGRITAFTSANGLTHDFVRAIYEDHEGSLWIGTNGGLNRLRDGKFIAITSKQGLSNNNARTVCEAPDGTIWIGTDGGGVDALKDGKVTSYTTKNGLSNDFVKSIFVDRKGVVWIGTTGGGLNRLEGGRVTRYTQKEGLPSDTIYALCEDPDGGLWIGTYGGGVCRFKDGKFTTYGVAQGLSRSVVRALYADREGGIWIGTTGGGLNYLKDEKFTVYTAEEGLASDIVFAIHGDAEGNLWIGTSGGLNRLRDGRFTTYTTKQGLFDDTIFQILEDDEARLWMSCNRGVFRVDKKGLDRLDAGTHRSILCTTYGKADGMGATQCNGSSQPAGWKSRDGRLWFPTVRGVAVIDPKEIPVNRLAPPVVIERFLVDGQPVDRRSAGTLGPGVERLEVHYAGLSLLVPERVRFRYQLEGFDREWIEAGTRRSAYYTNLPPGDYRFRVIACNSDGIWNDEGASFAFTIRPPLWQTWWAYLLYAVAVASLWIGGSQLRLRAMRRRTRLLETKVVERTAELAEKVEQLDHKNTELVRSKEELVASYKQTEAVFSALSDVLPGYILDGKYQLESKIGSGGFGTVYRATHLDLERPVAVKVFRPSPANATPQNLERFRLEGMSACRIQHVNAVSILDSGVSTGSIAYIVMELLNGHSLIEELREKGRLTLERTAEITVPVCDVLARAHASGVIHRDIKPENIFLHQGEDGEVVKVVDFGIAKLMGANTAGSNQTLTEAGEYLGTPIYMSPERIDDKPYDGRSDVYSVGVMVYEMLTGEPPFRMTGETPWSLMLKHLSKPPTPLGEIIPDIPSEVEAAVMRALAKVPENRPTAEQLRDEMARAVGAKAVGRD